MWPLDSPPPVIDFFLDRVEKISASPHDAITRRHRRNDIERLPDDPHLPHVHLFEQSSFKGNNVSLKSAKRAPVARMNTTVRASGTDYGLGLEMSETALKANGSRAPTMQKARAPVPLELEEVRLPTHTHTYSTHFCP